MPRDRTGEGLRLGADGNEKRSERLWVDRARRIDGSRRGSCRSHHGSGCRDRSAVALADGFAEVLDLADEVILLPIYPARELPIDGVSSEMIVDKMKSDNKRVLGKDELANWIKENYAKTVNKEFGEVLITAGAGDIDMLVEPIKNELKDI